MSRALVEQAPVEPAPPAAHGASPRARRLFIQFMLSMAGGYLFESLLLFGFWWAGYISLQTAATFSSIFLGGWLLLFAIFRFGWNRRFRDPLLFLPQYLFSIVLSAAMLVTAPQISIQPLAIMSVIFVHGFMAPDRKNLIIAWTGVAIGVMVMIGLAGERMSMPSATPEGRVLILLVMLGCLIRCMGFTTYVRKLQRSIREKNAALKEALARNEELAQRDDLTGIANRRHIMQILAEQKALHERTGTPFCVALMDVDFFKHINDHHGHVIGDQVLIQLAQRVGETMRVSDRFGRYGGEEFLALFVATGLPEALASIERIRASIESNPWSSIVPGLLVTVTCGVAQCTAGDSVESLIRRADEALYAGKGAGRNRIVAGAA